jgi:hypothetical protein
LTPPLTAALSPLTRSNCNWQGLYENMALLRHWRASPGAHVLFVNADEYLVYHAPLTGPALRTGIYLLFTLLFHTPALIAIWMYFC